MLLPLMAVDTVSFSGVARRDRSAGMLARRTGGRHQPYSRERCQTIRTFPTCAHQIIPTQPHGSVRMWSRFQGSLFALANIRFPFHDQQRIQGENRN
jgi:hypothetical protein